MTSTFGRGLSAGLAILGAVAMTTAAESVRLRAITSVYVDGKGAGFRQPDGVGCGGQTLAVSDTGNGRIVGFSLTGDVVSPVWDAALAELPRPAKIRRVGDRGYLVLDLKLRRLGKISPRGEFQGYVDLQGAAPPTPVPRSFERGASGDLFVLDIAGGRVLVADDQGRVSRTIALPPELGSASDVAVDGRGTVYVVDSVGRRVFAAGRDANAAAPLGRSLAEDVDFPTSILSDASGRLVVGDLNGSGIVILGADGSFRGRQSSLGWKEGFLRYPSALCEDEASRLFVADRENNRVQVFSVMP